jgi:hypothetical protein
MLQNLSAVLSCLAEDVGAGYSVHRIEDRASRIREFGRTTHDQHRADGVADEESGRKQRLGTVPLLNVNGGLPLGMCQPTFQMSAGETTRLSKEQDVCLHLFRPTDGPDVSFANRNWVFRTAILQAQQRVLDGQHGLSYAVDGRGNSSSAFSVPQNGALPEVYCPQVVNNSAEAGVTAEALSSVAP